MDSHKVNRRIKMNKRNPCRMKMISYDESGLVVEWQRGYIQERSVKHQQYLISPGVGGDDYERWYDYQDVVLTKGHWTNKKPPPPAKSFWRRAK